MKKIGIVTEYFYPHLGGITEHVYFFSKELAKRGFEVVILTGYEGEELDVQIPPSLRIIRLGKSVPIYSNHSFAKVTVGFDLGKKVQKILQEEKFDLLHIHSPLVMTLPLLFLKYTNTVTVGTLHTYFDSFDSHFFLKLFRKTVQQYLDKMDGVVAVSKACIDAMSPYFRGDYTVIANGVETEWFANPSGKVKQFADGSPNVLFLGRLDPRNGLGNLLTAFPYVLQKIPEARLVVVGDGPMRPFFEKKAGSLLKKKVFFEGQINGNRPDYFATCDVFCYPATMASFGVTLLEAMAAGKPIVVTDNTGFRQVIEDGVNGVLVPEENPQALAKALVRVIEDKAFASQLGEHGQKWVKKYSWPRVTDQVLDFYNQVYLKQKGEAFAS